MNKLHLCCALGALSLVPVATSQAALIFSDTFESDALGALAPAAVTAGGGTVTGAMGSSIVTSGSVTTSLGTFDLGQSYNTVNDSWLNFGAGTGGSLAGSTSDYTVAAWIQYADSTPDGFVVGTAGSPTATNGAQLHLGHRADGFHSGHWGDDLNSVDATNTLADANTTDNQWQYVVWTNDGATGTQDIYVDGVHVASGATGGGSTWGSNLLIGNARNDNGRDFIGQIAGVAIYDEVLTVAEHTAIAASVAIPEPSHTALLGLGLLSCALRRRR